MKREWRIPLAAIQRHKHSNRNYHLHHHHHLLNPLTQRSSSLSWRLICAIEMGHARVLQLLQAQIHELWDRYLHRGREETQTRGGEEREWSCLHRHRGSREWRWKCQSTSPSFQTDCPSPQSNLTEPSAVDPVDTTHTHTTYTHTAHASTHIRTGNSTLHRRQVLQLRAQFVRVLIE